jgi:hypothetical protein
LAISSARGLSQDFPCVGAKSAVRLKQIQYEILDP